MGLSPIFLPYKHLMRCSEAKKATRKHCLRAYLYGSEQPMNQDASTGPLAGPFSIPPLTYAHLLAPHWSPCSRTPLHLFVCSLTQSTTPGLEGKWIVSRLNNSLFWTIVHTFREIQLNFFGREFEFGVNSARNGNDRSRRRDFCRGTWAKKRTHEFTRFQNLLEFSRMFQTRRKYVSFEICESLLDSKIISILKFKIFILSY